MRSTERWLWIAALAIVIAVAVTSIFRPRAPSGSAAKPAASVENRVAESALTKVRISAEAQARLGLRTERVEQRAIPAERSYGGEVVAPTGGAAAMTAPASGTIRAPRVGRLPSIGTRVERGQIIVELVPLAPMDRDMRAQSEKQLAQARARLEQLRLQASRAEGLAVDKVGSERAAEEARSLRDVAQAEVTAAEARLRLVEQGALSADVALALRAPWAGVLQKLQATPGQTVAAGAPLFEIVASGRRWVRVPVFADEAALIDRTAQARVHRLGAAREPGRSALPTSGVIADPLTGALDLYYELDADEAAPRVGQRVGVSLRLAGGGQPGPAVPWSAVVYDSDGGAWVYERIGPEEMARRRVQLGAVSDGWAALVRGVSAETEVVTVGAEELLGVEFGAGH